MYFWDSPYRSRLRLYDLCINNVIPKFDRVDHNNSMHLIGHDNEFTQ
jgi:hypothetical protein